MYRVEDKYICTDNELFLLESRIGTILSPDAYSGGSAYKITSLYFDDIDNSHMADSEDGNDFRSKYRIRIYNGCTDVIKLEVKYKAYNRVLKKSRTIDTDTAIAMINGVGVLQDEMSENDPVTLFNLAIKQDMLRPRVIVEYDRSAYTFEPGNVRITFDRNVRKSDDIDGFLEGRCTYSMLRETNSILEVKYDEFLPGFIAQLLEVGNMIQTSYSKYRLCASQTEG